MELGTSRPLSGTEMKSGPSVWEERASSMDPYELQRLYLDDVWRYVSSRIDHQEDAEDVTMEVMSAAFRRLREQTVVADPRLWLLTIAKNKVADCLRRKYRRREAPLVDADHMDGTDHFKRFTVNAILDQMTEDHSQALVLKYVNGLTTEEVAAVIGRSTDATNSLLQRARSEFRVLGADSFDLTDREDEV